MDIGDFKSRPPSEVIIRKVKPLKTNDGYFCPYCGNKLKRGYFPLGWSDDITDSYYCKCDDWVQMESVLRNAETLLRSIPSVKYSIDITPTLKKIF